MRIVVGGIYHESNTFSPLGTGLAEFRSFQYKVGEQLLADLAGTNTEIGGFLDAAGKLAITVVPTVYGFAVPSGPVTREAFEDIAGQILAALTGEVDGVFLSLHGALVVDGGFSGDEELLQRTRDAVPSLPIVATFDLHANLSDAAIAAADILIGYDTFPHQDFAERGSEAAHLLTRMVRGGVRPAKYHRRLPLLTVPLMQRTEAEPMRTIIAAVHEAERRPGVWCCSAVPGFVYADVPHLGFNILAYGDAAVVAAAADAVADTVWSLRQQFLPSLIAPAEAVEQAMAHGESEGPTVLVESADNVGGGSPGDSTHVLDVLLTRSVGEAAIVIWDPVAAAAAQPFLGAQFSRVVGGHAGPLSGRPVPVSGSVELASRVRYKRTGSYMTGQEVDMGLVAVVRCGDVRIVLTEHRVMPFDSDHLTCLGIDPASLDLLVVKSGSAWRAGFGPIAARSFDVDTPGVCTSNVRHLTYRHARRPLFPLDQVVLP